MRPCSECAAPIENNDTQCPICGGTQRQTVEVRSEVDPNAESPISQEDECQELTEINLLWGFALAIVVALFGLGYLAFGTTGLMLATGLLLLILFIVGQIAMGIGT